MSAFLFLQSGPPAGEPQGIANQSRATGGFYGKEQALNLGAGRGP